MWKRLTLVWIGCLLLVSLQPARPAAGTGLSQLHRPFHFVAFAVTALLLARLLRSGVRAILTTVGLGVMIEVLQHLFYGSRMEWWDLRDDTLAAVAVVLVLLLRGGLARDEGRVDNDRARRTAPLGPNGFH